MRLFKNQTCQSIFSYITGGPRAIEARLAQLDSEMKLVRERIYRIASLNLRLKRMRWISPALISKIMRLELLRRLGRRTLKEIQREQSALKAFLGEQLRTWEIKPVGEAPPV